MNSLLKTAPTPGGKAKFDKAHLALPLAALLVTFPLGASEAQTTGFNKTSGSWSYTDSANWVDGNINGVLDSSLTLTNNLSITFDRNTTLLTGLTFNYTGSRFITLSADTTGPHTLTLGGDVTVAMNSNQTVTFGSTAASQALDVDLGGVTRTFNVAGANNVFKTLVFANGISNGSFIATGGGRVFLNNASNTLSGITVSGVDLSINGSANTGVNTTDILTGALTVGPGAASSSPSLGASTITLTTAPGLNTTLRANNLVRQQGTAALFRGTGLGTAAFGAADVANVRFTIAPALSGTGSSGTTLGIIAGVYGDTSATGNGFGATGGLVTYDAATGIRLLTASEYKTSLTNGQTDLDNILLANASGATSTVTLNANTTVNSLSLSASATAGSGIALNGTGTLKLNSGVLYATTNTLTGAESAIVINNTLDLNGGEGIVLFNTNAASGNIGGANLQLAGAITNDGGKGLTLDGAGAIEFGGAEANTYTGVTTLNGGNLRLNKTIADGAIAGDLAINGGRVLFGASNQLADSSNVTINGGILDFRLSSSSGSSRSETFNNLLITSGSMIGGAGASTNLVTVNAATLTGGLISESRNNKLVVNGLFSFASADSAGGGTLLIDRSNSSASAVDTVVTVNGGLSITNPSSGAYTPITINPGTSATNMGGRLLLASDLAFTGNATNANTATIAAPVGSNQGSIALSGTRTFDIGDGAAGIDLTVAPALVDNGATVGSLVKTGLGVLALNGNGSYTGGTTVSAGTLIAGGAISGSVTAQSGSTLAGTGTLSGAVAINGGGTLAPGNAGPGSPAGKLTAGNNVTFADSTAHFSIRLGVGSGIDNDQLSLTGAGTMLSLNNADLHLTLGVNPILENTVFVIVDNVNPGSSFSGLFSQGNSISAGGSSFQIVYGYDAEGGQLTGGNDIALIALAIPEPKTWAMLVGGFGLLAFSRRLRRGVV